MVSSKTTGFCKNEDCPSSQELLEFQKCDLSRTCSSGIRKHLASCEFCAAEVEFYSRFPQDETVGEVAEIPAPLYDLAEALLKNRHADASSLNSLLTEKGGLVVDKA
jgi:hypothetical protein